MKSMEWYVVHAYSGYENKVRETLIERIERFGMEENLNHQRESQKFLKKHSIDYTSKKCQYYR